MLKVTERSEFPLRYDQCSILNLAFIILLSTEKIEGIGLYQLRVTGKSARVALFPNYFHN